MISTRRRAIRRASVLLILFGLIAGLDSSAAAQQEARIGDLTVRQGVVPRRLVGYGLVVGLDGTGDRSFGTGSSSTMTVRSVVNLLRRFNIEVPPEQLRLRNVAAVLITAELSPYLRPGGRFEVQVAAMGDATSLRGGVLWISPLVADPNQPPLATAQGAIVVPTDGSGRISTRQGNAGRIADGGVLEVDQPVVAFAGEPRLALRQPDLRTATRIAAAIAAAFGAGTARAEDPGSILLNPGAERADSLSAWLAAVDTLTVTLSESPRIVIDGRDGTVVVGARSGWVQRRSAIAASPCRLVVSLQPLPQAKPQLAVAAEPAWFAPILDRACRRSLPGCMRPAPARPKWPRSSRHFAPPALFGLM